MGPNIAKAKDRSKTRNYVRIATVVLLYWSTSITAVFINKSLLSGKADLQAPYIIAWFQSLVAVLVTCPFIFFTRAPHLNMRRCADVAPLSIVFVTMIALNNLFLSGIGVSFYYIGRSLSTVFSVLLSYLILGQKTNFPTMLCCGVVTCGFFLGVDQEEIGGTITVNAVVLGIHSSLFAALNAIYTTKVLPTVGGDIWKLNLYNNVNACLLFIPLIVFNLEPRSLLSAAVVQTWKFWGEMVIAGICGLAVGYATGLQISETSPLTHNISGISKSAVQTIIATQIDAETKTSWWWWSNGAVLLGSLAYTWLRTKRPNKETILPRKDEILTNSLLP